MNILKKYADKINEVITWVANSLVGANTKAKGNCFLRVEPPNPFWDPGAGPASKMWFKMGTKNAAVFPLPVWAQAMRSRFAKMMGKAFFCEKRIL